MKITGIVGKKPTAAGSKSEREVHVIKDCASPPTFEMILRKVDGNAMYDETLDAFVGRVVEAEGIEGSIVGTGNIFIASKVDLAPGYNGTDGDAGIKGVTGVPGFQPPGEKLAQAIEETPLITLDDFGKVKLRTAKVVSADIHPKADKLLILQVQVGDKTKQIVAGIRQHYAIDVGSATDSKLCIVGRTIIIVDNLKPATLRGQESNGMLLAVRTPDGGLRLLTTDGPADSGLPVG